MEQYNVTGMSCAACQARVEKAVSQVAGVDSCAVSLLTNSMGVTGTASSEAIIKAVTDAGYGASLKTSNSINSSEVNNDELKDNDTPLLLKRLIASLIFLIPLMYVSMGHMLFRWPLPSFLNNHISMGLFELLFTGIIMVINQKFFVSGFKALLHKSPNMDTLVALGSSVAFTYSVYALFKMASAQSVGDLESVMSLMDEFYFESAATILTLITVGKMLEARAKGKTTDALKGLIKMAPKTASVLREGNLILVPINQVIKGDRFAVKPGESIPVDGIVVEGSCSVDESAITGESVPVDKSVGDNVTSATINKSGYIVCEATRVGEDTTLSQIIQMVSDAAATKAPIAKIADRVSGIFVPVVIGIALFTLIVWLLVGQPIGFALTRAISVLVISCPCALGLATPVAIMVGNGVGAKNGIMFKTAVSLEETGKALIVALDKTGTITQGEPSVTDIVPADGVTEEDLIKYAFSLENKSEHPLSRAIVKKAKEFNINVDGLEITDFRIESGCGLTGKINNKEIRGGNENYVASTLDSTESSNKELKNKAQALALQGKTPLYFSYDGKLLGLIAVADVIKEDSIEAINELKEMGLHVVMLTGDNEITARAIGIDAGVDEVVAGVKPDGKDDVIKKLQEYGKVIMVGDGINDAPALTSADVGIAIVAGTDIAIDAADVVLMKNSIKDVAAAIRLSRKTLRNIHENLFWAFFYNIIGIPLAAGLWIPIFGWTLTPMFGAAAMSLSSFCVVTNALRLNLVDVYDKTIVKAIKNSIGHNPILDIKYNEDFKEEDKMEITVNGMMCGHCEAHVKSALEKIDGVVEATANHNDNLVTITTNKEVSEEVIKAAVIDAGYDYVGIK
ncbi:MAG: heavy metal translocating P-type ATPase [Saccharofermentans sp.]|nr:heavy metal translocating P-type ATPase [Saccharofermentans sp.]